MKRKIFSKLLMGALLVASVSSFVSCKDYDDDINNLQDQINAKAALSELSALQSTLDSKIAAAQSAAQAAQATADKAATATSVAELQAALEQAIAAAKQAGTDAGTKAGEAITAANKAQATADGAQSAADAAKTAADAAAAAAKKVDEDAKAALAKALEDIKAAYATKAEAAAAQSTADAAKTAAEAAQKAADAAKAVADAAYTKAQAEELKAEVEALKEKIESGAADEALQEAIQEAKNAAASVEAIWSAVTSVELIPSSYAAGSLNNTHLYFLKGTEVTNAFGSAKAPAGNAARDYDGNTISEIKNYTAGQAIKRTNRVIVRVNPVNAEFTADDVVLINSKGESLNDILDVEVEKFTGLLTTRADYETGLWAVTFTRKATAKETDFDTATQAPEGYKYDEDENPVVDAKILYAIGINNSKDAAENRFCATAYDIRLTYGDYQNVNNFNFNVIDKDNVSYSINALHNRYSAGDKKLKGEDQTAEDAVALGRGERANENWSAELVWKPTADPAVDAITSGDNANAQIGDARFGSYKEDQYIEVDGKDRTFVIDGIIEDEVQWYYVTLDRYAAVESSPSEFVSWNSYEYDGLYTVTNALDRLRVTIKSEDAIGDIIGFRVFAVNFDGTLADPDGRAFYVKVGQPADIQEIVINGSWIARVDGRDGVAPHWDGVAGVGDDALYNSLNAAKAANPTGNTNIVAWTKPADVPDCTLNAATVAHNARVSKIRGTTVDATRFLWWQLLDSNKMPLAAGKKLSDVAYIAAGFQNSLKWVDTKSIKFGNLITIQDADHHNKVIATVSVEIQKLLPTTAKTEFSWRYGLGPDSNGTLNIYPQPAMAAAPTTAVAWTTEGVNRATFNLNDLTIGMDGNFELTVTGTTIAGASAKIINESVANAANAAAFTWLTTTGCAQATGAASYDGRFVFNDIYSASLKYNWPGVSLTCKEAHHDATDAGAYTEDPTTNLSTTGVSVWYANNHAKKISVGGMNKVCFKDALEPGIQTYALKAYNYSYKPSATATATTITGATNYMLFYNGKAATLTASQTPYMAGGAIAALGGNTLVKYGDNVALERFVASAPTNLADLAAGTNAVNMINSVGAYYFTSAWNTNSYAYGTTLKATTDNANGTYTVDGSKYRARLVSGTNTEYYYTQITAAGNLIFTKIPLGASSPAPTTHTALLKIYAVDAYGRGFIFNDPATAANFHVDDDLSRATPIMELPIQIVVE